MGEYEAIMYRICLHVPSYEGEYYVNLSIFCTQRFDPRWIRVAIKLWKDPSHLYLVTVIIMQRDGKYSTQYLYGSTL